MVVRDRTNELERVPAEEIHNGEEQVNSMEHDKNCEHDNFVTFLAQIEKMNSWTEKIEENNRKIKETQKNFFDEPSTRGRELYQADHNSLMKVSESLRRF